MPQVFRLLFRRPYSLLGSQVFYDLYKPGGDPGESLPPRLSVVKACNPAVDRVAQVILRSDKTRMRSSGRTGLLNAAAREISSCQAAFDGDAFLFLTSAAASCIILA